MTERRIISVEVVNEHGVLARIAGLFAGRGYNIETLTVAPIPGSNISRVTIETSGNKKVLEQIVKQLHTDEYPRDDDGHRTRTKRRKRNTKQ